MAKRNLKSAPKRAKSKKVVAVKRRKTTQVEFLALLIAQTAKHVKQSDGRPDHGMAAQLLRLQAQLAELLGSKKK